MWTFFFFLFFLFFFLLLWCSAQSVSTMYFVFFFLSHMLIRKKTAKLYSGEQRKKKKKKKWKNAEQQYTQIRQRSIDRCYSVCVNALLHWNHGLLCRVEKNCSFGLVWFESRAKDFFFIPSILYRFEPFSRGLNFGRIVAESVSLQLGIILALLRALVFF